jgi:hypothetical protein
MVRPISFFAAGSLALLTVQVALAAVTPESFLENLDEYGAELTSTAADQTQLSEDRAYEHTSGFFPALAEEASSQTGTGAEIGSTALFTDVPTGAWFARYASDMAEQRIMEGYKDAAGQPLGTFGPADPVTIEQIAKMAVIAARVDQTKCPASPKNAEAGSRWSAQFIACAEQLGWQVFADGAVDPSRSALRSEVVTTVLEAFGRELEPASGTLFQDVSSTMPARHAIETAARDGIVSGYTNSEGNPTGFFGPFDNVNRAETAKIFSLALDTYGL